MTQLKMATERLINSVWTLVYKETADNEIEIISFDRNNWDGYAKESQLPKVRLKEEEGRIVWAVYFWPPGTSDFSRTKPVRKFVSNPQHVFSYTEETK